MKDKKEMAVVRWFKRVFNFKAWFDYDRIKAFTLYIVNGTKKFFVLQTNTSQESFESVMRKFKITEEDLLSKQKGLWRLSLLMVIFASLIFFYAVYNLFLGHFIALGLSLIVMAIALVLAFRYHFWYFQIKKRKLGCTFSEWYEQGLRGKHS